MQLKSREDVKEVRFSQEGQSDSSDTVVSPMKNAGIQRKKRRGKKADSSLSNNSHLHHHYPDEGGTTLVDEVTNFLVEELKQAETCCNGRFIKVTIIYESIILIAWGFDI